jgi:hypothetical protein
MKGDISKREILHALQTEIFKKRSASIVNNESIFLESSFSSDNFPLRFNINDLRKYTDAEFITYVYRCLLRRFPKKEEALNSLNDLRFGRKTKDGIIWAVSRSKEGRERKIPVKGIKITHVFDFLKKNITRIPVLGNLIWFVLYFWELPKIIRDLRKFNRVADGKYYELKCYIHLLEKKIENIDSRIDYGEMTMSKIQAEYEDQKSEVENILRQIEKLEGYKK